jgi:hypothetical protein
VVHSKWLGLLDNPGPVPFSQLMDGQFRPSTGCYYFDFRNILLWYLILLRDAIAKICLSPFIIIFIYFLSHVFFWKEFLSSFMLYHKGIWTNVIQKRTMSSLLWSNFFKVGKPLCTFIHKKRVSHSGFSIEIRWFKV